MSATPVCPECDIAGCFHMAEFEQHKRSFNIYDPRRDTAVSSPTPGIIPGLGRAPDPLPLCKTLRDEFAMSALQGLLTEQDRGEYTVEEFIEEAAELSYKLADAMLRARG